MLGVVKEKAIAGDSAMITEITVNAPCTGLSKVGGRGWIAVVVVILRCVHL